MSVYPWLQPQWQQLTEQVAQDHLAHAYLLLGQAGLGKADFAQQFAQYLLCENRSAQQACGLCRGCQLFAAHSHPDFYHVKPEAKSTVIKVDQVRTLIEKVNNTSQQGGYQVVILEPAEAMNRQAANALLKTLEEPAGDVVFLLVCHQTGYLPATILSRCQTITFNVGDKAAALAWLQQQLTAQQPTELLLALADGAPLRALSLAENDFLTLRGQLFEVLTRVIQQQQDPIGPAAQLIKQDMMQVLDGLQSLLSDMLKLRLGASHITNADLLSPLQNLSTRFTTEQLQHLIDELQQARVFLAGPSNPNVQLLLENILMGLCHAR